jgi:hypothetical protein
MNSRAAVVLLIFVSPCAAAAARNAFPVSPTTKTVQSPNGKFTLTLDESPTSTPIAVMESKLTATITTTAVAAAEPLWSTSFVGTSPRYLSPADVSVSDDGNLFIVIDNQRQGLFVFRKGLTEWTLKPTLHAKSYFQSIPGWIYRLDRINNQPVLAVWNRDGNDWVAYNISDKSTTSASADLKKTWTDQTRRDILDTLERARQADLRGEVKILPKPIARLVAKNLSTAEGGELREIHYEFLATLQNPADRQWIERLMEPRKFDERRFEDIYSMSPTFVPWDDAVNYCQMTRQERLIGDWLLRVWDHKIQKGDEYTLGQGNREASVRTSKYLLGRVEGVVRLSTPFTPLSRAGDVIRFILFPVGISGQPKTEFREDENFTGNYYQTKPASNSKPVLEIPFTLNSVLPGDYQLKVVWDKRRPFLDVNDAGPGDYESKVLPFKITAGQTMTNFMVECTNRVQGGESYYKADEIRLKLIQN